MGDGPESCGGRAALTGPSAATVRPSMVGVGAQREAVPGHMEPWFRLRVPTGQSKEDQRMGGGPESSCRGRVARKGLSAAKARQATSDVKRDGAERGLAEAQRNPEWGGQERSKACPATPDARRRVTERETGPSRGDVHGSEKEGLEKGDGPKFQEKTARPTEVQARWRCAQQHPMGESGPRDGGTRGSEQGGPGQRRWTGVRGRLRGEGTLGDARRGRWGPQGDREPEPGHSGAHKSKKGRTKTKNGRRTEVEEKPRGS